MCVDENQNDTKEPIIFSEWTLPFNDSRIQRRDYTFAELLYTSTVTEMSKETGQISLFENDEGEVEPIFLKQYIFDYRRVQDYDK